MSNPWVARHAVRIAPRLAIVLGVVTLAMGQPGAVLADEEDDESQIDWAVACGIATPQPAPVPINVERPVRVRVSVTGANVTFETTEEAACSLVRDQGPGTRVRPGGLTFETGLGREAWRDVCNGEIPQMTDNLKLALTSPGWTDGAQMDHIITEFFGNEGELILHFQRSTRVQGFAVFERAQGSPPCHETNARWEGYVVLVDPQVPGLEEPWIPTVTELVNLVRGSTPG